MKKSPLTRAGKSTPATRRPQPLHLLILLASFALASWLPAQTTFVWNPIDGPWSNSFNWQSGSAPTGGSGTTLIFGGGSAYASTNDIGSFLLSRLHFTNMLGQVTLDGQALQFVNSSGAALPALSLGGAGSATITNQVNWNGNTLVTNVGSGTLLFNGTQNYANGTKQTFINSGTGTLTLADAITYASAGSDTGIVLNVFNYNAAAGSFNVGNLGGLGNFTLRVGGTGIVRFSGSTGGDLFSGSGSVHVLSGATFDFNGNGESMGAVSGAGTIMLSSSAGVNGAAAGYYLFSGRFTGNGTVAVSGASQILELSGATSTYTGATSVTAGQLIVSANAPSGSAGALGNATSEVLVGNTSGSSAASLLIGAADVTVGRNIRLQSGNTGVVTVGALNTSGTSTFSGNVTLGTNSAAAKGLTILSTKGGTLAFDGSLLRATGATGVTDTLTLNGSGTVILRGSNTFTGTTTVNGGTLLLDHSSNNNAKVSASAAMVLAGGSLGVQGSQTAATTVTVNGLVVGNSASPTGGGGRVTVTSGADQNATLSVGDITRYSGAAVDFRTVNTGSGVANITTSTANGSAGILGGYATFNGTDWAVNDGGGNIAALAAGSYSSSFASGLNTSLSANVALASGGGTTNSLRFTATSTLSFNAAGDVLNVESGGILVAPGTGLSSIGVASRRGVLSTTGDLIVHQNSTSGTFTINAVIRGTGLTKSGEGTLMLTGTNTYTGNTVINGGTLTVSASANLGVATTDVVINGGTLALASGGTLGTLNAANRVITIGPAGGTFHFLSNQSFEGSGLAGTGNLTLTGTGILSFGSSGSTFTGHIFVNNGQIRMNSPQLNNVASITVASGATYNIEDDITDTFSLAASGRLYLNGDGVGGTGAFRLSDQTATNPRNNPVTTFNRSVVLQTTSRIQVDNSSAGGNASRLILTANVTGEGGLTKSGNGQLYLTARDNDYAGATRIEAGILGLNLGNDRLPTGTTVTLGAGSSSGVFQLNGYSQTIAGLDTSGTGTSNAVVGGNATSTSLLVVNLSSGSQSYAGTLGGTGVADNHASNNLGFVKDGAGTFELTGASTYSGATTVEEGTLKLGHAQALGGSGAAYTASTGGTTVNGGATLDLNGQGTIQEIITLNGAGVGGTGALVNNSTTTAVLGGGVASFTVPSVTTTGWSAGATVTIEDPGGAGATATATAVLGLSTDSYTIPSGGGGSGYGLVPTVTISGGTGASAYALVGVTNASFTVAAAVPGTTTTYSVAPTVTLQNGATGEAILDANGYVIGINVLTSGSGFTGTPTATFSGGTVLFQGTNPTATGNNVNYTVAGLVLVNAGTGFTSAPVITITGGSGTQAGVVGNDNQFVLQGFSLTNGGSGYTTAPTVTVSGGTATVSANLSGIVLASDSSIGGTGDVVIHSVISGEYSLTKSGTGTTVLAGSNSYSGMTLVKEGTLQVGLEGVGTSGAGDLVLDGSGAVLSGTGTVTGATTSVYTGAIKPGDEGGSAIGTLTTQSLTLTPASETVIAEFQVTGSTQASTLVFDVLHINGNLTIDGFSRMVVDGTGYTAKVGDVLGLLDWTGLLTDTGFDAGTNLRTGANGEMNEGLLDLPDISGVGLWDIAFGNGNLTLTVVAGAAPEPSRLVLLVLAFAGMALRRRRRQGSG